MNKKCKTFPKKCILLQKMEHPDFSPFKSPLKSYWKFTACHKTKSIHESPVLLMDKKIQYTRSIQYLSDINLDVSPYRVPDFTLGTKYRYTAEH